MFNGTVKDEMEKDKKEKEADKNNGLGKDALKELIEENNRAWSDLVCAMPYNGSLMMTARRGKSTAFLEGCGHTAFKAVLKEIQHMHDGDKIELNDEFNADIQLNLKKNPREYVQSLMVIAEKLERRYNIIKSEEDIIHQVLKVVGSRYKEVVGPLKTEMHRGRQSVCLRS